MSRNFGEKELLAGTALRNTGLPAKWTETMDLEVSRHRKKRKQTGGKKINIKLQKKSQNIHESESSDTLQIEVKEADRAKVSQLAYMEHTHDSKVFTATSFSRLFKVPSTGASMQASQEAGFSTDFP